MKITSLIENTSKCGLPSQHGLSLFIETSDRKKILFDTGQDGTFLNNAKTLGINISETDFAVISHGHYDHGGGLDALLKTKPEIKVYLHRDAFKPHYSLKPYGLKFIGLAPALENFPQLTKCGGFFRISDSAFLFGCEKTDFPASEGSKLLFSAPEVPDVFPDEISLALKDAGKTFLFAGCAHKGIVNILETYFSLTKKYPDFVFGGFHTAKSSEKEVHFLSEKISEYEKTVFYTMHCTGSKAFEILKENKNVRYFSCGESFETGG